MKKEDNTMLNHLKEVFLQETMEEMAYPDSWSWDVFKSLKSYAQRVKYCEQHLTKLGAGSARIAFRIDDDKILKIAKNDKGMAQNEAEARLFFDGYIVNSGYQDMLARVYEMDEDNYLWIEMDLLTKVKPTEFKNQFGISINDFDIVVRAIDGAMGRRRSQWGRVTSQIYDDYNNGDLEESNPELHELIEFCTELLGNFDYAIGDFGRLSSFGKTVDNRIVVVDYGLTWEIFDKFYDQSKKQNAGARYAYQ
jgi:hypothetical protein